LGRRRPLRDRGGVSAGGIVCSLDGGAPRRAAIWDSCTPDWALRAPSGLRTSPNQFGILTCPPAKVIWALAGGASAMGGTSAAVSGGGGAPGPRGVVWTTWLGGSGRPCRRWSYIRSIPWTK